MASAWNGMSRTITWFAGSTGSSTFRRFGRISSPTTARPVALRSAGFQPSLSRATPSAVSEHCPELIGCPISRSLAASRVCLELRPLPSPSVTRLHRYYEPLRHPMRAGLSLAGVRLVIPDHAMGLPVLRAPSLCACRRQYPGAAVGRRLRSSHPAVSAFPEIAVGSACTSSFSRLARRSLALRPAHARRHLYVTRYTEGFSHFVTSMTAPVASGWSVRRWDSHPLESAAFSRRTQIAAIPTA